MKIGHFNAVFRLRSALLAAAAMGGVVVMAGTAQAQTAPDPQAAADEAGKDDIVVTAQKRNESLKDVPISIAVLSGEQLDKSSFASVTEALRSTPGIAAYTAGQSTLTKVGIRGVSSNGSIAGGASTVGFYLDDAAFAFIRFPYVPDTNSVYDLERIEVLRGPQGTLYGAGNLNGVVRVLTGKPDLDEISFKSRGAVSLTEHGGTNFRADGMINVPIIPGKLAFRGSAGYSSNSGWLDRPVTNSVDVNSDRGHNFRGKLLAAPTDNFQIQASAWLSRTNRRAPDVGFDNMTTPSGVDDTSFNRFDAFGLTMTYDFDGASLTSATNKIKFKVRSINSTGSSTNPIDTTFTQLTANLTSQELRLVSTGESPWQWSLGAMYRNEQDVQSFRFNNAAAVPAFLSGFSVDSYFSRSFALYGELSRSFGPLKITGGLRYFHDEVETIQRSPLDPSKTTLARGGDSFDPLTGRVVIAYDAGEAANLYASFSQGFRSGFAQSGAILELTPGLQSAVQPDRLTNYEIGSKGSLFDRMLSYEIAAYYIKWKDTIQVRTTLIGPAVVNVPTNSPGVSGPGIDASLTFRPAPGFSIGGTFSWNDLKFDEDVRGAPTLAVPAGPLLYPKGSRPPETSAITVSGFVGYETPVGGDYTLSVDASVNYVSKMLTPAGTAAASLQGDDIILGRLNIGLESPDGWNASLFVDNISDENPRVRPASPLLPFATSDRIRPRTIGLQLELKM